MCIMAAAHFDSSVFGVTLSHTQKCNVFSRFSQQFTRPSQIPHLLHDDSSLFVSYDGVRIALVPYKIPWGIYKSGKLESEELLIFSEAQVELQDYDVTTLQHTCYSTTRPYPRYFKWVWAMEILTCSSFSRVAWWFLLRALKYTLTRHCKVGLGKSKWLNKYLKSGLQIENPPSCAYAEVHHQWY
jgi:hypothetical protein